MRERRGRDGLEDLCSGPGKLTQALDIGLDLNGADLTRRPSRSSRGRGSGEALELVAGPRIGITKAVDLPWRYCAAGNRFVSGPGRVAAGCRWRRS